MNDFSPSLTLNVNACVPKNTINQLNGQEEMPYKTLVSC